MVHVASEMQRNNMNIPLLIGGATTSEIHTAVKIAPQYDLPVIQVKDASRCVGVLSGLLSKNKSSAYVEEISIKYRTLREKHESEKAEKKMISLQEARKIKLKVEWEDVRIVRPAFIGNKVFRDYPLEEISKYIDWTFFFHAWKINGKYPAIFDDPVKGEEAQKLYNDGQQILHEIIKKKMLQAEGVIGFYPASGKGDDVLLFEDKSMKDSVSTLRFLRNQEKKKAGVPNLSLADFIAPIESGITDYIGGFAVTAGVGIEKWVRYYEERGDDYSSFMLKIMADRLAEAFTELMHEKIRKEFWGYDKNEHLLLEEILKAKYQGIRPAPGYPACPEHSEKRSIFELLGTEANTAIRLTENYAMYPAASVSGYYFMHPFSQYFNLGKIDREQIRDYAKRKSLKFEETEKLLKQNLLYE
jgi:5-methyltetrahydrofolate--homocysteine methyltransferase